MEKILGLAWVATFVHVNTCSLFTVGGDQGSYAYVVNFPLHTGLPLVSVKRPLKTTSMTTHQSQPRWVVKMQSTRSFLKRSSRRVLANLPCCSMRPFMTTMARLKGTSLLRPETSLRYTCGPTLTFCSFESYSTCNWEEESIICALEGRKV